MDRAVFGWYGVTFEHPDDWAPAVLSGNRKTGYVRLASPQALSCQLRWQVGSAPDLARVLRDYLGRLEKASRKRKHPFRSESKADGERIGYRWVGESQGRGILSYHPASRRILFLEVGGRPGDSLKPTLSSLEGSLRIGDPADPEVWSMLGLSVRLPAGLSVERKTLVAGRTGLSLRGRGTRIQAERWGFARQLVERHGLAGWAQATTRMPRAEVVEEDCGLRLASKPRFGPGVEALVRYDDARNQITWIRVEGGRSRPSPSWDWFTDLDGTGVSEHT